MHAIIFTGYERSGGLERVGGAYRIATVLRKEGWDVEVIDFFYHWNLEQLKELIKIRNQRHTIDWIGFSSTWINYSSEPVQQMMIDFLSHVKSSYPSTVTIAGGQNPNINFPIYNDIDYIINGFGEIAIVEVLKYIYGNGTIKGVPRNKGWYVDANSFYQAWPISDLSIEYEPRDYINQGETLSLEFSRGCKFSCAFCNFPVLGVKEDTTRDLTILEQELKRNYDLYGVRNYQVADETLNDRDEKLVKIGNIAKNIGFELNFNAFIRADILISRPQQMDMLAEARVWSHYYGIETFNHETGKAIGKGMSPDKIQNGLLNIKNYFNEHVKRYRGTISLIYGLPHETKESILQGQEWLKNHWNDQNTIAFPLNLNLTGKKSKIDEDYEKYGYTIMGEEKRKLYNRHNFFSNDLVMWENPHMNMYDAIELVDRQIEMTRPNYIDAWKLFSLISLVDIDEALKINEDGTIDRKHIDWNTTKNNHNIDEQKVTLESYLKQEPIKRRARELKDQYIQNKLSL